MKMVLVEGKRQKRGGCSCVKENRRNVVVVVVGAKEKIDSPKNNEIPSQKMPNRCPLYYSREVD